MRGSPHWPPGDGDHRATQREKLRESNHKPESAKGWGCGRHPTVTRFLWRRPELVPAQHGPELWLGLPIRHKRQAGGPLPG